MGPTLPFLKGPESGSGSALRLLGPVRKVEVGNWKWKSTYTFDFPPPVRNGLNRQKYRYK